MEQANSKLTSIWQQSLNELHFISIKMSLWVVVFGIWNYREAWRTKFLGLRWNTAWILSTVCCHALLGKSLTLPVSLKLCTHLNMLGEGMLFSILIAKLSRNGDLYLAYFSTPWAFSCDVAIFIHSVNEEWSKSNRKVYLWWRIILGLIFTEIGIDPWRTFVNATFNLPVP